MESEKEPGQTRYDRILLSMRPDKSVLMTFRSTNFMHLRGIGYAFAASLIFGLGAVFVRLLGKEIDATVVAFLNLSIGGLLVTLLVLFTGAPLFKALRGFKRRDWLDLFL